MVKINKYTQTCYFDLFGSSRITKGLINNPNIPEYPLYFAKKYPHNSNRIKEIVNGIYIKCVASCIESILLVMSLPEDVVLSSIVAVIAEYIGNIAVKPSAIKAAINDVNALFL